MAEDYEYRGLIAQSWDLLRGDTSNWDDRFFYKDVIAESGQPVLDVGCGTGRLLFDYMSQDIDIDGVDNSPEMLDLCRKKAEELGLQPNLYLQTMETLDLPRKYRTIIVPSSSFQLVLDPGDAKEAMRRFFKHLEPGGVLAMPFMVLWTGEAWNEEYWTRDADGFMLIAEKARPEDGATVRRWMRVKYDVPNQLEHTENRYEVLRDGEVIASEHHVRSPATRWYTQEQAANLYKEAGFTAIRLFREFTHEPASETDTTFSILGTRP
jgi:ubiquinone/menaquinone biosynthesis C-methylase UbiE